MPHTSPGPIAKDYIGQFYQSVCSLCAGSIGNHSRERAISSDTRSGRCSSFAFWFSPGVHARDDHVWIRNIVADGSRTHSKHPTCFCFMDALRNLPTYDHDNFSTYMQSEAKHGKALHIQESLSPPAFRPYTSQSGSSAPQVVPNEQRDILLREFYHLGLQRAGQRPLQQDQRQQQKQKCSDAAVSPKRQLQPQSEQLQRAKQQRIMPQD